jgi:RNA polymerase sigma-70 factor, ECF subfamily
MRNSPARWCRRHSRALTSASGVRDERALATWVWRTLFRLAFERTRRERQGPALPIVPDVAFPERDPQLSAAVRELSPQRRMLVFLRYYADLSYAEIAQLTGLAEGTVAATLSQARNALLATLTEEAHR